MSQLSPLNRKQRQALINDPKNPTGFAICDGCGFLVNHDHLREKMQYRGGAVPVGTGLWVCGACDDVPQPYYQLQVLPPDPVPLVNPRPPNNAGADTGYGYLVTGNGNYLVTNEDTWDWGWLITAPQTVD